MVAEHYLKTWPHAFAAVRDGRKRFEFRSCADRDFGVGDILELMQFDPTEYEDDGGDVFAGSYITEDNESTQDPDEAATFRVRVTYVLHGGGAFGVPPGYCVMSIEPLPAPPTNGDADG